MAQSAKESTISKRTNSTSRRTGGVRPPSAGTFEGLGVAGQKKSFLAAVGPSLGAATGVSLLKPHALKSVKAAENVIVVESSREPSLATSRQKRGRQLAEDDEENKKEMLSDLLNQTLSTEAVEPPLPIMMDALKKSPARQNQGEEPGVQSMPQNPRHAHEKKSQEGANTELSELYLVPPPNPLPNLRGSCSMNSPLHCILQLHDFLDACLAAAEQNKKRGAKKAQPCPFVRLLESLRSKRTAVKQGWVQDSRGKRRSDVEQVSFFKKQLQQLKSRTIDKQISELGEALGRGYGEDSRQFLELLLHGVIHEELNKHANERPQYKEMETKVKGETDDEAKARWAANAARFDESPVYDFFGGQTRQYSFCVRCGDSSTTFAPFLALPIGLPKINEGGLETRCPGLNASSLEKVLHFHYASRYPEDLKCMSCGFDKRRNRFESVSSWPRHLVLAIQKSPEQRQAAAAQAFGGKRKKTGKKGRATSVTTPAALQATSTTGDVEDSPEVSLEESGALQFPEVLQVPSDEVEPATPQVAKKHQGLRVSSSPGPKYQLVSVVAHISTVDVDFGGHFTAFVRKSVRVTPEKSGLGRGTSGRKKKSAPTSKEELKESARVQNIHQWFQCDDDEITPVSVETVLSQVHSAYILFYDKLL